MPDARLGSMPDEVLPHEHPYSCHGEDAIWWTNASQCIAQGDTTCTSGDAALAMQDTAVARCGPTGSSLRYFNRSMTMDCLDRLARSHSRASQGSSAYRVLLMGVSNMRHIWHAMTADDIYGETLKPDKACGWGMLSSFAPHVIRYAPWLVVTNTTSVAHASHPVCVAQQSIHAGAGAVTYATATASAPYDVVAISSGTWDASFTSRNILDYQKQLGIAVHHLKTTWPHVRILLLTPTPCSPMVLYNQTPPAPSKAYKRATPKEGCEFVANMSRAIERVARQHAPATQLVDAHQMATSHPAGQQSGYPGIWLPQAASWHLAQYESPAQRAEFRAMRPRSAAGEMNRAIANRIWDVICPHTGHKHTIGLSL
jgi:hypothetical protein